MFGKPVFLNIPNFKDKKNKKEHYKILRVIIFDELDSHNLTYMIELLT